VDGGCSSDFLFIKYSAYDRADIQLLGVEHSSKNAKNIITPGSPTIIVIVINGTYRRLVKWTTDVFQTFYLWNTPHILRGTPIILSGYPIILSGAPDFWWWLAKLQFKRVKTIRCQVA
jgi:hypothetical protein